MKGHSMGNRGTSRVIALAVSLTLVACGGSDSTTESTDSTVPESAEELTPVNIVVGGKVIAWAPIYVARDLGYFEDEGLAAEVVISQQGAPAAMSALLSGDAFVAMTGLPAALAPIAEGAPLKLLFTAAKIDSAQMTASPEFLERTGVTPESSLEDRVRALDGATVGIYNPGDSVDQLLRYTLQTYGIDPNDLEIISLQNAAGQVSALQAGQIDVMIVSPPAGALAEAEGFGRIFIRASEVPPLDNYPYLVGTARASSLDGPESDMVKGLIRAMNRALDTLRSSPEDTRSLLRAEFAEVDDDSFEIVFEEMLTQLPASPLITEELWGSALEYAEAQGRPLTALYEETVASQIVEDALNG
jgi:NitT/TauT family transport system substrate-binding protein